MSPSRPPLRRAAPEQARSGFPFLIGMAALVLAVGIGSVARFCPQDLRFESGGKHPAKSTPADAKPLDPTTSTSVITPTTFTTIGAANAPTAAPTVIVAPAAAPVTTTAKKTARGARVRGASSAAPTGSASASPALPENPYPEAAPSETYGF